MATSPPAIATTLHVPADYPTIQSCIDAAISGQDECVVAPGTYNELINFLGKAITLRSSDGPQVTTIDGTGLNGSVVKLNNLETALSVFDGFAVTGGTGTFVDNYFRGGGLYISDASPTIRNCIFESNEADEGGAIWTSGEATISNCTFSGNTAQNDGGGIGLDSTSSATVSNCTFSGNRAVVGGGCSSKNSAARRCDQLHVQPEYGSVRWRQDVSPIYHDSDGD
jgi:parallel beta-helix repeat protein